MGFEPIRQGFEDVEPGSYPSGWERNGSTDQRVVESTSASGSRSLELAGTHGGCWQALANAPFGDHPGEDVIRFAGAIKPAVEGEIGCHDGFAPYGSIVLRTDVGGWDDGNTRQLLRLRTDGIRGSGLQLGSFDRGEWLHYDIGYRYDSDESTVTVSYWIGGEKRGSTTVDAMDDETALSHVAFRSGDFTGYWDEVSVTLQSAPTPAGPQTSTDTETPIDTPSPATATATPEYDLREANVRARVRPLDTPLLVLSDVPGGGGSWAVVTTDYRLVDTDTARDAFVTYEFGRSATGFDWRDQLEYARRMRGKHGASELWNRAASVGWEALAAYAMAHVNPAAAVGPVLEALQDSTAWAVQEITDPYMEAMSKQTQWTYTYDEIRDEVRSADSLVDMSDYMFDLAQTGVDIASSYQDGYSIGAAARAAYSASGSITTSLSTAAGTASGVLFYVALGDLVSRGVDSITTGMEQNAKLSAIGHAYSTTRIPVIQRIIELETARTDNALSPCDAWELAYLTMNHHYMGAFANHGMYRHAHAIEQSTLGGVWDALVNVDEVASVLADRADSYQWGGAAAHHDYGERIQTALGTTEESLNRAAHGSPTRVEVSQ